MIPDLKARAYYQRELTFLGSAASGQQVTLDAGPDVGRQDEGFRPTEMVLIGLAGCTGMDVISILRKMRQDVTAYRVEVQAVKALEYPKVFTEIEVEHVLSGRNLSAQAIEKAVNLSWQKYCQVSAMLSKAAKLTHRWRIEASADSRTSG